MQGLPFNLNLLRTLDILLETRNLTAAAAQLGLTQSALSRQLAQLRTELNDPLLIREGQHYLLSARAVALRDPLKQALAGMAALLDVPGFDPAQCTRTFTLGGSDYIADNMLPELVGVVAAQAPQARIAFRMWSSGDYRALSEEGIDLLPAMLDIVPENLHGHAMGEDKAVCVMRASHPLAGQTLSLNDYLRFPHASINGGSDKDSAVDRYLAKRKLQRNVQLTAPFFGSVLRIIANNDYLLTIPEHIALKFAQQTPIVIKPLPFATPVQRYWLLWHARSHHDPAHQWFRRQVFDVLHGATAGVTQFNLG
jgi:DNA-binding transcriptional LysR family regulator